jgi:hypothetical protein
VDSLSARITRNSVVYPTIRVPSHPGKLLMGVYDEDGYVEGTVLDRRAGEQGAPVPRDLFPLVTDGEQPEAIYAGPLYFHFGHFLLESLARAWYARRQPEALFAWAGQHTWQGVELKPWQREILDILGITNPTRIIADPARFELLHVPDIGYRYDDRFHPEHADFLARHAGPRQVPGHRLWVSRSQVDNEARDLNAAPTERRLAQAGWTVAHPETLTVREQLDHLARAEVVAGEEGSAFHALMLLKDVASKKFHIVRRHGREHGNLHTIGEARHVDQSFSTIERQLVLRAEGRLVSKITPSSAEILDTLNVPVPAAPDPRTVAEPVLERTLAGLAPRRFLDVGATTAHLVVTSTAPVRVAVSPRFAFDPRSYADSGVDFYDLALKTYADLFHHEGDRFDVIRIAGPDFSEVMDSFRVSKRLAHRSALWILGTGDVAARAALSVRLTHPGFAVRRLLVRGRTVYLVRRLASTPHNDAAVGRLSAAEVKRRNRWLRPAGLRRIHRLRTRAQG